MVGVLEINYSVKEAADFFNINRSTLTQYLCGFRTNKTTLKYV